MPETPSQRRSKGLYTMKELAAEKAAKKAKQEAARKVARNTKIIKDAQAKQTPGSMYKSKGSDIPITTSAPAKKKPTQKKVSSVKKGVKLKTTTPSVVNAQKKKTTTTATKRSNRAARKTDKLRSKGKEALASGNLRKAKRLSDRSRRTAKKAIRTRK